MHTYAFSQLLHTPWLYKKSIIRSWLMPMHDFKLEEYQVTQRINLNLRVTKKNMSHFLTIYGGMSFSLVRTKDDPSSDMPARDRKREKVFGVLQSAINWNSLHFLFCYFFFSLGTSRLTWWNPQIKKEYLDSALIGRKCVSRGRALQWE